MALATGVSLMVAAHGVAANRAVAAPKNPQAFGTLRAVIDTIDYLDPQQAYTGQSWWAMWNVYETLLTYRHVDGPAGYKLVPGLAQSLPTVSRNGKVYKFKLRKGLKYSSGAPVKATDFEWAIKRGFLAQGQGVGFYTDIAGAEAYSKNPTPGGDISGITANNAKRTINIRLDKPRGDFLTILALLFAAPVPANTDPSIQNGSIPGTGPYKFSNYDPNRSFTMVRNPYFKATKYIPKGNPNTVEVALVGDADAATQRVINGQSDYSNAAIPPDRIADAKSKGRLILRKTANTYYFWMNIREAPFNKLKVRQAVNYALDRKALQTLVWGGLGRPTQNVLPPTYPSYRKLNLYPHNLTKAKTLITQAGAKGAKVTVWTRNVSDAVTAAQYYTSLLNQIGLDASLNVLPRATYYTTIGNVNTHAQTGCALARGLSASAGLVRCAAERQPDHRPGQQQLRLVQEQEDRCPDREPEEGSDPHARSQCEVGEGREADHAAGSVGAMVEPRVPGVLQQEHELHPHPASLRHRSRTSVQEVGS